MGGIHEERDGVGTDRNFDLFHVAWSGKTGFEPTTSGVTDQRSNQLSYFPFSQQLIKRERFNMWNKE